MKGLLLTFFIAGLCLAVSPENVLAQDEFSHSSDVKGGSSAPPVGELAGDKQQIKEQRQAIKAGAREAMEEEHRIREQIHEAVQAGDLETARRLKEEFKAIHQENVHQKRQDLKALQEARQELRQDILDKREDVRDRREDIKDKFENVRDRREDIRDKREDIWDRRHDGGRKDKLEDIRDRKEDVRDRKEDIRDEREDVRDRRDNFRDRHKDIRGKGGQGNRGDTSGLGGHRKAGGGRHK